ncbi:MAG: DUF5060 domain-containing protein [Candidatus Pacebacteria bacterium]|nr:DUF5060 domain-containing protein [Candidatus Paceibacterota bacterium]
MKLSVNYNYNQARSKIFIILFSCFSIASFFFPASVLAAPSLTNLKAETPGKIEKFNKFEISFNLENTDFTNPYFPYDPHPAAGIEPGIGVSVDALFLPPGEVNWQNAKKTPCFYYQPVREVGSGSNISLLPEGPADWRCRFSPEEEGSWKYQVKVTEAAGSAQSAIGSFETIACTSQEHLCKGYLKVSQADSRFFEFSNGEPFVSPLLNMEEGNPFNDLSDLRQNIAKLGNNGARFIRWFPTGEGANFMIAPYGDWIRIAWGFSEGRERFDIVDTASGKKVSFRPYYYSTQQIPAERSQYRFSFRGRVEGQKVMRLQLGNSYLDICSETNTIHKANGFQCAYQQSGWHDYSLTINNSNSSLTAGVRGLYVSAEAPSPFNASAEGSIRLHSMVLQRDETGRGDWGPNLLTRGDPDTHLYVDQPSAARLDEALKLSERYGVYHKLTVFEKNDRVLNHFQPDGSFGDSYRCDWGECPVNFYSADGQAARWYEDAYARYFIGRWSYSPSIHSLELCNESGWYEDPRGSGRILSFDSAWHLAGLVHDLSPRHVMMTNSFWGYWIGDFFNNPEKKYLIDYSDQHLYSQQNGSSGAISNIWQDSAAYVRECFNLFRGYRNSGYLKPIIKGEGGVAASGTDPQHPEVQKEPQGLWYHKKLWAHIGILGSSCDGEWYPRMFKDCSSWDAEAGCQYPNTQANTFKMFQAYETFMKGEPVNNGSFTEIGTDLENGQQINTSNSNIRAWGVKSNRDGRMLLWIDNRNHTWTNPQSSPVSSTLTISGLLSGEYDLEWWNTRTGQKTNQETKSISNSGQISLAINNLEADLAIKLIPKAIFPTNPVCRGDVDNNGQVNADDFYQIISSWGREGVDLKENLNDDGKVNGFDLIIAIGDWGCGS